ncbi:MAG TPA: leucine--tRNA ligase [Lacipirellulaceae bacterium]|nr:leucine--tRNA ligase [Lacipirellulaceae bacterium]
MPRYNPATIEPKWQAYWEEHATFAAPRTPAGPKLYALDMFPYPSGDGLHVGHPEGYTATDIVCRAARMQGKSVVHPMGFDSFGLPAEEHAIKTGVHPRVQTEKNIATFRRQLKSLGFSYDWSREIATTDVEYFRWTQWIFLQVYDTWFDVDQQKGRPIAELPIPDEVRAAGPAAIDAYRDDHRLAYQSYAPVNWCPALGTVLANEEVIDGKSEVGGHPVVRMPLRQWKLRITAYADRLERDLEGLDWHEGIKALQRNWIGRSTGAEVDFFIGPPDQPITEKRRDSRAVREQFDAWEFSREQLGVRRSPGPEAIRIYTTRPDTLFGATYLVIAPEHPEAARLTSPEQAAAVQAYCEQAAAKSDLDRTELAKDKSGVFTGSYAFNPVNDEAIPIWIADYVLASYGSGAIMAVPAHDDRDFEFAVKFGLPVTCVVQPAEGAEPLAVYDPQQTLPADAAPGGPDWAAAQRQAILRGEVCYKGEGVAMNSGEFDGLLTAEFKPRITAWLAHNGVGREAVNYKLRDWLFSRQRFWGEPFPILHELDATGRPTGRVRAVPEDQLPVDLPHLDDFKPHGRPEPPLDKAPDDWLYPVIDGVRYKRETNTMPQWAGSCWYYLRFLDPRNTGAAVDPDIEKAWMPVDLYVGGAEHAVLHLLYSRFWHKVLYDRGVVSTPEPFQKLVNQGMILGENNEKMSKSRGNVINRDEVVREYGADALRLYEMFMGPLEATKPWSMEGVNGVYNFLGRAWRMIVDDHADSLALNVSVTEESPSDEALRVLHKTIKAVTDDIASLSFNSAIARRMEFVNYFTKLERRPRQCLEPFVLLLAPFAPHLAEELWSILGHGESLAYAPWPQYDAAILVETTVELPVQINGKVRGKICVPAGADRAALISAVKADAKIAEQLAGRTIIKEIVVPGRLVSFVVKG